MNLENIEGEAELVLRLSHIETDTVPSPLQIATTVMGEGAVRVHHASSFPGDACLVRCCGGPRIYLRRGLTLARARWAIAHELGHYVLKLDSSRKENEDACDAFAAALLVPRLAFRLALRQTQEFASLARFFRVTESCVALRYGEVTGKPLALVTPERIRTRGEPWAWPEERELRMHSIGTQYLQKFRLSDDRKRVVFQSPDTLPRFQEPDRELWASAQMNRCETVALF